MKPRPAATGDSVARIMRSLGTWGVELRVPPNPTLEDMWKALDFVLRNLPDTSGLTIDALVGHQRLRWSWDEPRLSIEGGGPSGVSGDGGCSQSRQRVRACPEQSCPFFGPYFTSEIPARLAERERVFAQNHRVGIEEEGQLCRLLHRRISHACCCPWLVLPCSISGLG